MKDFVFLINETSERCDLLTNAFIRYYQLIFNSSNYLSFILHSSTNDHLTRQGERRTIENINDIPSLNCLYVNIENPCDEWPSLESNESCNSIF